MNHFSLQHSCSILAGVGEQTVQHLAKLGIVTLFDLLLHFPFRYENRTRITPIAELKAGDTVLVEGFVYAVSPTLGYRNCIRCCLQDETGQLSLLFFHQNKFLYRQLPKGGKLRCYGEIRATQLGFEMIHPDYEVIDNQPLDIYLRPVYRRTQKISQAKLRYLIQQALTILSQDTSLLPEYFSPLLLPSAEWPSLQDALRFIHYPPVEASLLALKEGKHIAQQRVFFEELLAHQLYLTYLKKKVQSSQAHSLLNTHLLSQFLQQLPFQLTHSQQTVLAEITTDLKKPVPMLRLLQGDVGCGKTVIAAAAIFQAVSHHHQAVLLVPTEIVAEQHYQQLQAWFSTFSFSIVLLKGQLKKSERQPILQGLAQGTIHVVVATHAVFQADIQFCRLALIVVDEHHRFGIQQRTLLHQKAASFYQAHQLWMTATPIPRTLMMECFAGIDCSIIDTLPQGRRPVITSVIAANKRQEVMQRIRVMCRNNMQVYWVCPLIEESEQTAYQAVHTIETMLSKALPELKIALLHGRMPSATKEKMMQTFKQGKIDILVATTVIEVGVDVPNANIIVIENAERLGLSQCHQLRGRVGRGSQASYCILLYQEPLSDIATERLKILRETTDGFKIAERDLQLRGPGELLGYKQSGLLSFRTANWVRDYSLFPLIEKVLPVLKEESVLAMALITRWLSSEAAVLSETIC